MSKFTTVDTVSESAIVVGLPPKNRAVVGRLQFDPDEGASLQLLDRGDVGQIFLGATAHYPAILGQLVNGPKVTIVDAVVANTNWGAGGFADVRIVANQLLIGVHLPDPTIKPFDEVRVVLTGLNEWFGVMPIHSKLEDLPPPETGRQVTITCKHLPRFGFSPTSGGPSLGSHQVMSTSGDRIHDSAVQNQFELCLRPRNPFGLDECVQELFRLQALMSILCGQQVFYKRAQLFLHGLEGSERHRNAVTYMPRFARPAKEPKKRRIDQVLFPLPLIQESLPSLWCAWTERYEQYRSAVELFTSTELFGGQLLNFQLLAIMQALETFHRNRFGGMYALEDDYKAIESALKAAIPTGTADDLRSALKSKLKYGNEYSLRKRLYKLANGLPGGAAGSIGTLIHPALKEFLSKSVDTRNYLTHYTVELESEAFREADLYWATRLLRWFFVAVLLHDMGLPEGQLVDAFTHAEDLTHARQSLTKTGPAPGSGIKVETAEKPGTEPPTSSTPETTPPATPAGSPEVPVASEPVPEPTTAPNDTNAKGTESPDSTAERPRLDSNQQPPI